MPFEDLLSQALIDESRGAVEKLPPRTAEMIPEYGITTKGKVLRLRRMTPKEWDFFDFKKVTGQGWPGWYEATFADRTRFATRKKGKPIKKQAGDRQPPSDDYLARH